MIYGVSWATANCVHRCSAPKIDDEQKSSNVIAPEKYKIIIISAGVVRNSSGEVSVFFF